MTAQDKLLLAMADGIIRLLLNDGHAEAEADCIYISTKEFIASQEAKEKT